MKSFCVLNSVISSTAAESLGKAAVQVFGEKIAVLSNCAVGHSIAQGVKNAGGCALLFDACFESQIYFAAKHFSPDAIFFAEEKEKCSVTVYDSSALPVSPLLEEKISMAAIKSGEVSGNGDVIDVDLSGVYYKELLGCAKSFEDINAAIISKNGSVKKLLSRAVLALGGTNYGKTKLCISPSGLVLSAVDENGKVHTHGELMAVCCACALENNEKISVPFTAAERIVSAAPLKLSFERGEELWQNDAVFLAAKLMGYMSSDGCGLAALCQKLIPQAVIRKSFSSQMNISDIADLLECDELITDNENAAFIKNPRGSIYITKNSRADRFCVEACAASAEIAQELALDAEKAVCLT